jgi:hypothetical protein
MMGKKFQEIIDRMSPERQARVQERTQQLLTGMLPTDLRDVPDMKISTLVRIVEALGGNVEIVAHLPNGDVRAQSPERPAATSR